MLFYVSIGGWIAGFAQGRQQFPQTVMVDLVHQRELAAEFAARESFARQPVEVRAGQIGQESALVFSEGHGNGDKTFKVGGSHAGIVHVRLLDWYFPLQTLEGIMMSVYVVKTGEQFLCTAEDGDIGMAPAIEDATSFGSYEEAEKAANTHADPGYEIVAVCVIRH
ncbi:hypothetical protein BUAM107266_32965 [Burkholderia ambifaria]